MKRSMCLFAAVASLCVCGCVSPQKKEGRPLACVIRQHPAHDTPITFDGGWANFSSYNEDGYFLFFSTTRSAPQLTSYFRRLEEGACSTVLRNADLYVGSQLNVPLVLFGCHSWSDLAFAEGGL